MAVYTYLRNSFIHDRKNVGLSQCGWRNYERCASKDDLCILEVQATVIVSVLDRTGKDLHRIDDAPLWGENSNEKKKCLNLFLIKESLFLKKKEIWKIKRKSFTKRSLYESILWCIYELGNVISSCSALFRGLENEISSQLKKKKKKNAGKWTKSALQKGHRLGIFI